MPPAPTGGSSNSKRLMAAGAVVLMALGAFLFVRDYRTYTRLDRENDQVLEGIIKAQRQIKTDIPKARDYLAGLEIEQDDFNYRDRLPDSERLEELFDRMSEFEHLAGVQWKGSTAKKQRVSRRSKGGGPCERRQYVVELDGTFFEFCRFVNLLETMPRFVSIDEFTMKPARREYAQEDKVICAAKLTFSVYTLKKTKAPSRSPKPKRGRTARS